METLNFTQEQVTKILTDIAVGKEGINKVLKIFLEALMRAERREHNERPMTSVMVIVQGK